MNVPMLANRKDLMYICSDTACRLENKPVTVDDRDGAKDSVREIYGVNATLDDIYIYIYIYVKCDV